ncbi:MAG: hypothetical protein HQL19_05290, partial [Candidatus Omnitrophica bacterium]|nr:hypothetical protein [Candidatus Omnitrophota bacterium]
ARYFETSAFLVFLAIGNSVYFFGRSHENNILNIAASLLAVFFLLCDMLHTAWLHKWPAHGRRVMPLVAWFSIVLIGYTYSGRAMDRIKGQAAGVGKITAPSIYFNINVPVLRAITKGSAKVLFLAANDFSYYYKGGYTPQGYFSFSLAWPFMKEYLDFLNARVREGYYLIMPLSDMPKDFLPIVQGVNAAYKFQVLNYIIVTNNIPGPA